MKEIFFCEQFADATEGAAGLKSVLNIAVRQKIVANTTKVEYENRKKSVIFRAGRILDNFLQLCILLISMVSV